ncbi:hypothetical protein [Polymorphospora rubra]
MTTIRSILLFAVEALAEIGPPARAAAGWISRADLTRSVFAGGG